LCPGRNRFFKLNALKKNINKQDFQNKCIENNIASPTGFFLEINALK